MSIFPKLEAALDHGMSTLDEVVKLVRVGRELLLDLRPVVAALPRLVATAQEVLVLEREAQLARRGLAGGAPGGGADRAPG